MGGRSQITEFERALGRFLVYRSVLSELDSGRQLYLAVPTARYDELFDTQLGKLVSADYRLNYIVYDPKREVIEKWIESTNFGP